MRRLIAGESHCFHLVVHLEDTQHPGEESIDVGIDDYLDVIVAVEVITGTVRIRTTEGRDVYSHSAIHQVARITVTGSPVQGCIVDGSPASGALYAALRIGPLSGGILQI